MLMNPTPYTSLTVAMELSVAPERGSRQHSYHGRLRETPGCVSQPLTARLAGSPRGSFRYPGLCDPSPNPAEAVGVPKRGDTAPWFGERLPGTHHSLRGPMRGAGAITGARPGRGPPARAASISGRARAIGARLTSNNAPDWYKAYENRKRVFTPGRGVLKESAPVFAALTPVRPYRGKCGRRGVRARPYHGTRAWGREPAVSACDGRVWPLEAFRIPP